MKIRPSTVLWGMLLLRFQRRLMRLFDNTPLDQESLNKLQESSWFQEAAELLALYIIFYALKGNTKSWREAAAGKNKSREIYLQLRRDLTGTRVEEAANKAKEEIATTIKSLPSDIYRSIVKYTQSRYEKGISYEEVQKEIQKRAPKLVKSRVQLIARTLLSSIETELTKARSLDLGIEWYVWETARDQRTRFSHSHMQSVLVNWYDPPSPELLINELSYGSYHAGCTFNCRCTAVPLIDDSKIGWPARVYLNGSIVSMNLKQFKKLYQKVAA